MAAARCTRRDDDSEASGEYRRAFGFWVVSASITIELHPSGTPGRVHLRVWSDELDRDEIVFTLRQALEGFEDGSIDQDQEKTR